jgi:peptidoglycan hydrolase-like protein with peptidoglycan-binding domain
MKNLFRSSAFACLVLCLVIDLSSAPAQASNSSRDIVRVAQIRMAELGYFTGAADGIEGRVTERAILHFQRDNGLALTGRLTPETFAALSQRGRFAAHLASYYPVYLDNGAVADLYAHPVYNGYYHITPDHVVVSSIPTVWEER